MAVGSSWLRKIFSRRVAVAVLITLATIVMLVGSLNVWTKRQLLDTDEWVETSSQLLENDHIRHAISIRITEAAFERADPASYLPEQAARLAPLVRARWSSTRCKPPTTSSSGRGCKSCGARPTARRTRRFSA